MTDSIVQTSKNVTLVGASKVNKGILADALTIAPYLVAADGGAKMVLKYGKTPKIVIGDFDSIDAGVLEKIPADRLHRIDEQETTDFDKCLGNISAPVILGVGFLGRRIDHQLAALNSLLSHAGQTCILISKRDVVFHLPKQKLIRITVDPGTRVSLFPLRPVSGHSAGLQWPISGVQFTPGGTIGTSNRALDNPVELKMDGSGMLAILPRQALRAVVRALTGLSAKS